MVKCCIEIEHNLQYEDPARQCFQQHLSSLILVFANIEADLHGNIEDVDDNQYDDQEIPQDLESTIGFHYCDVDINKCLTEL